MPHPNQPVAVLHPEAEVFVALNMAVDYDLDDILVKAYPQFFTEIANAHQIIESVKIEKATAEPGQKRTRTKPVK